MNVEMGIGVSGYYEVDVIRNKGLAGEYTEYCGRSDNLILNGFFGRWQAGTIRQSAWRFFVGSGSAPPSVTDNQLQTQIGSASNSSTNVNNPNVKVGSDYFCSNTGTAEWALGAIVGNISEIGVNMRNDTANNTLDSRALIVDGLGNPTTITVTAQDQLVVRYTLRFKIPTAPHISVVNFEGVPTTCTLESLGVLNSNHWNMSLIVDRFIPRTECSISGSQTVIGDPESTTVSGVSSNFTGSSPTIVSTNGIRRRVNFLSSQGNQIAPAGIRYLVIPVALSTTFFYQGIHFDPPLMKNNQKTLVLDFDYTLTRA
jgi:hypothetical protein